MGYSGVALPRLEDRRLLTGGGRYVDDLPLPGVAEVAVLRSPHAHARIRGIDVSAAQALPGVLAVITAADLGEAGRPFPCNEPGPGFVNQSPLADGVVRYAGEAVAFVVAESRYAAEDALDLIAVDYEPLPVCADLAAAVEPGAPQVHAAAPGNVACELRLGCGDVAAAFAAADKVVRLRLRIARGSGQPMETRAVAAEYREGRLTVWINTQRPHHARQRIAERLGLPPSQVRVIAPDVGGGFGIKGNFYPEELLVPWAAVRLGRPVRYVEDRREHFLSAVHDRLQVIDIALAADASGRLLGLELDYLNDLGAYAPYGGLVTGNVATHAIGPYRIPAVAIRGRGVYTHRTPTAAYRGAGRPQGTFAIERALDELARALGLDPAELRRRNFIPPAAMPYDTGVPSPRGGHIVYDSGDYPASQALALAHLDYAGWRAEQARLRAEGRLIGIGLANYIEIAGTPPFEGATVAVAPDGAVVVRTGACSQGQGHATSLAQICADALGVSPERVRIEEGDTAAIERGIGTFGSRTMIVAGSAIRTAALAVKELALQAAAQKLEAEPADLEWGGEWVAVRGAPSRRVGLADLAAAAELRSTHYFSPSGPHVANGTQACVLEIDPATGFLKFHRYIVVEDCGVVINPMGAEGQLIGGVAQGLGGSLYERLVYDEAGQLLTASFADYLLPTAAEMPALELHHLATPSPNNPLGAKGAGEGGTMPVYAVIAAAVEDALGVRVRELPLTPEAIRRLLAGA